MNSSDSETGPPRPEEPQPSPEAEPPLPPAPAAAPPAPEAELPATSKGKAKEKKEREKKERERKEKKRRKRELQPAEPWQRYRALVDTIKEAHDLIDLADHKARFALIIMGALNAAIIIIGSRSDLLAGLPPNLKVWLYGYLGVYGVIAIYFLVQAIESLRPRSIPNISLHGEVPDEEASLGLRFFVDATRYDTPGYLKAWQSVRVSQLNTELAIQLHTLARINRKKYDAVSRLYRGLQAITVLTTGLLVALGVAAWIEYRSAGVPIKGGKPGRGGWAILGQPERLAAPGVREPSGIVFSPLRGTFFVVGDEGSLVEIDRAGKLLANLPMGGNLEDVALHTPSGRLVLLSEKKGELIVFDPDTGRKTGTFRIDAAALLGQTGIDPNQGFEGLAFQPDAARPGGGVFHLVHQRSPAMMVSLAFDPLGAPGPIGAESVLSRRPVGSRQDLTAVTHDAQLDRLLVIADSVDRIALLAGDGREEAEIVLPGVQQEGLTFDAAGDLWIADDRAGLLVFRGARARIAAEMSKPS